MKNIFERRESFGAIAVAAALLVLGACEDTTTVQSVQSVAELGDMTFPAGSTTAQTIDLSRYFRTSKASLTFGAVSSNKAVVTTSISGNTLTVTPVGPGTTTITVSANDGTSSVSQLITVVVRGPEQPPSESDPPMLLKDFADVTFAHDASSQEITLSRHFSGPMLVYTLLSSNEQVVTATESAGTLTLTPVGPGAAAVTVTASNKDGSLSLTISVTVEASTLPMLADGMSFMDLKMVADPSATDERIRSFDLVMYFRAGILLSFETTTSDAEKVAVYNKRDPNAVALTEAELDMAKMADGNMVTIQSRAVGKATITVKATNAQGMSTTETFTVTVIDMNTAPYTKGSAPDDITGANRLKAGDSKTVKINYADHFDDPDISERTRDDTWVLTAESTDTSILTLTYALTGAVLKPDEVEIVLTAVAGGTAMVKMKATDSFDRSAEKMFEVRVNHKPQPYGAQTEEADRTTLGKYMGFMDLSAAGDAVTLDLVVSDAGYFSDMDGDDTLTCSLSLHSTTSMPLTG